MCNRYKKKLAEYTENEIKKLCEKYNLHNYNISYIGCSFECPFHCPEPDLCVADLYATNTNEELKNSKDYK